MQRVAVRAYRAAVDAALLGALVRSLACEVRDARPTPGGSINEAYRVRLADGREVFVKAHARAPRGMFEAEARGLAWLRAGAGELLRVPEVLTLDPAGPDARFLVLPWIEVVAATPAHDEQIGRGLAALHHSGRALAWGLDHDNFVGTVPQHNGEGWASWPAFWREARLQPRVRSLRDRGLLEPGDVHRFDRLFVALDELVGEHEPARLHGDLWSGNLLVDHRGPLVIDPAVYVGVREVDLAMWSLFSRPRPRMLAAYDEVWPLARGWRERVELYQLYPLLVHVELFGFAYLGQLRAALRCYV